MKKLSLESFNSLCECGTLMSGPTTHATMLVLVEGLSQAEASRIMSVTQPGISQKLKAIRKRAISVNKATSASREYLRKFGEFWEGE